MLRWFGKNSKAIRLTAVVLLGAGLSITGYSIRVADQNDRAPGKSFPIAFDLTSFGGEHFGKTRASNPISRTETDRSTHDPDDGEVAAADIGRAAGSAAPPVLVASAVGSVGSNGTSLFGPAPGFTVLGSSAAAYPGGSHAPAHGAGPAASFGSASPLSSGSLPHPGSSGPGAGSSPGFGAPSAPAPAGTGPAPNTPPSEPGPVANLDPSDGSGGTGGGSGGTGGGSGGSDGGSGDKPNVITGTDPVDGDMEIPEDTTHAPGHSPGQQEISGDYILDGLLKIEIAGTVAGEEYDQLLVGGTAYLNGTIEVILLDDFVPELDDIFDVIIASAFEIGENFSILFPDLPGNKFFDYHLFQMSDGRVAFRITDPILGVAEPASIAGLVLGLAVLGLRSRRRRALSRG